MSIRLKLSIALCFSAAAVALAFPVWKAAIRNEPKYALSDGQAKRALTLLSTLYNRHEADDPISSSHMGTTILKELSRRNITARQRHISFSDLAELNAALILRDTGDWILATHLSGGLYTIYEPPYPPRKISLAELKTVLPPSFDCLYISTPLPETSESPRIVFDDVSIETKTPVRRGVPVKANYSFRNCGNEPLSITKLRGSCSCLAFTSSKDPISPGQTGSISVKINTGKKSGKISESVICTTNDVHAPEFILVLSGTVLDQIDVNPLDISTGKIPIGTPIETTVYIRFPNDQPIVVPTVTSASNKCEMQIVSEQNRQLAVKLSLGSKSIGPFKDTVTLSVQGHSFTINISGFIKIPEDVYPPAILLEASHSEADVEKILTISNGKVTDFDFSVSPPVDWIDSVHPIADLNQVQIKIRPRHSAAYAASAIEARRHNSEEIVLRIPIIGKFSSQ
jgi:hypothetical protein